MSVVSTWLPVAFLVVGALVAAMGARELLQQRRRRLTWVPRQGRIVASRLSDGAIRFQVAYEAEGREVRFWNRTTTGSGIDPVGREVELLANPADPTDAVVVRGGPNPTTTAVVLVAFGLVALVVGIVLVAG